MSWHALTPATTTGALSSAEWNYHIDNINHLGSMMNGASSLSTITAGTFIWGVGFSAYDTGTQVVGASATALVTWNTTEFDTNSAFSSNRFTVPAGAGGRYLISCHLFASTGVASYEVRRNGTNFMQFINSAQAGSLSGIRALADGDYIELYLTATGAGCTIDKTNRRSGFSAMKVG